MTSQRKMIDCLENQAARQQATTSMMMMHNQQSLPATANLINAPPSYRPLQLQTSSISATAAAAAAAAVDIPTNNNSSNSNSSNSNELIGYYFGSISRETADWILRNHGNQMDGAYLLRSSGPNDDFVLSLMMVTTMPNNSAITSQQQQQQQLPITTNGSSPMSQHIEVLHYKIVETEDSFVALHGQVGDEKFATIDELIDKAQGVATKPRWPINRQSLESQILPPTYWGLSVYQVCLAFFIKAKQWGFPLLPSLFQAPQQHQHQSQSQQQQQQLAGIQASIGIPIEQIGGGIQQPDSEGAGNGVVTTLSIETMRTLIYKSLHEFQPWFHGKISRDDAERRIEDGPTRDGKFLVRERDNYSYAMCICHRRATKHYRIDVLPTGELAIQDGRKFTSLMALVSHYTIMSDGLWCALTEPCPRPIQTPSSPAQTTTNGFQFNYPNSSTSSSQFNALSPPISLHQQQQQQQQQLRSLQYASPATNNQNLYCVPPLMSALGQQQQQQTNMKMMAPSMISNSHPTQQSLDNSLPSSNNNNSSNNRHNNGLVCANPMSGGVTAIKAPIKEWLQTINQKWTQLMAAKNQHQSLNSFLFGSQNPLNNHCRHGRSRHHHNHHHHHHSHSHSQHQNNINHQQQQQLQQQQPQQQQQQNGEHRRGTSRSHSSTCGCIKHQQQQQRLQIQIQTNTLPGNNFNYPSGQETHSRQPAVCSVASCLPGPVSGKLSTIVPQYPQYQLTSDQALNLSNLPRSSGFQLNGQSFVGSHLFAVKTNGKQINPTGSNSSGSNGSNIIEEGEEEVEEEEKLISPAQSISANLNQQQASIYGQNDIYGGSQPSTAIVNDKHMMTSSSSSSGTINLHNQINCNQNNKLKQQQHPEQLILQQHQQKQKELQQRQQQQQQRQQKQQKQQKQAAYGIGCSRPSDQLVQSRGQIMCGQHAGPAYRYTNYPNDENSFKPCTHRPQQSMNNNITRTFRQRAFDDSQLQLESSSQLSGQAALSKFVQFQDGQCLRTHRDTRSIQMAYLSSRKQQQQQQDQQQNRQLPLKVLNNSNINNLPGDGQFIPRLELGNQWHQSSGLQRNQQAINSWNLRQQNSPSQNGLDPTNINLRQQHEQNNGFDIDLMDCTTDNNNNHHFKLDTKLIKSSSIETLCGAADDEDEDDEELDLVLQNCKSNSELLQVCFTRQVDNNGQNLAAFNSNRMDDNNILKPIQLNNDSNHNGDLIINNMNSLLNNENSQQQNNKLSLTNTTASSSISEQQTKDNREKLDYINKQHDLDELYTALFAELDASLKAQVDLKNKCLGFGGSSGTEKLATELNHSSNQQQLSNRQQKLQLSNNQQQQPETIESNPTELIYEFDSLITTTQSQNQQQQQQQQQYE